MEDLFHDLSSFADDDTSLEGMSLLDTINMVKPNILIGETSVILNVILFSGLSAVGGLFNKDVLTAMNQVHSFYVTKIILSYSQNDSPPIIFPLSNPTSR